MPLRLAFPFRLAFPLGLAVLAVSADAHAMPDPSGVWTRGDGNARVRIARCGDNICATNIWIKDTSGGENVGDRLVLDLTATDEGQLAGTAYDPQRDLTYSMQMTVKEKQLHTRGCVLGGLLCRSISWARDE